MDINNPFYNKRHTEESIRKMSISSTKGGKDIRQYSDNIISLYKSGLSSNKIAEKYDVTPGFIRRILKENSVKIRKGGNKKGYIPVNKGKPCYS